MLSASRRFRFVSGAVGRTPVRPSACARAIRTSRTLLSTLGRALGCHPHRARPRGSQRSRRLRVGSEGRPRKHSLSGPVATATASVVLRLRYILLRLLAHGILKATVALVSYLLASFTFNRAELVAMICQLRSLGQARVQLDARNPIGCRAATRPADSSSPSASRSSVTGCGRCRPTFRPALTSRAPRAVSSPARSRCTRLAPRPDRLARDRGEHSVASLHLNRAGGVRSSSISRRPRTALSSPAQRDISTVNHDPRSSSPSPPIENETRNGQALRPAAPAARSRRSHRRALPRSTRRTGPGMPLPAPGAARCTEIEPRPGRSPRAVSLCSQLAGSDRGRRRGVAGQAGARPSEGSYSASETQRTL
jgi:hypothetical protein